MAASPAKTRIFVTIAVVLGLLVGLALGVAGAMLWHGPAGSTAAAGGPSGGGPGGGGPPEGAGGPGGMPPAQVRVAATRREDVQDRFRVVGRLHELRHATVAAEITGKVIDVPIEAGDPVTGGETVLARIEDTWAKLDLARAEAEVAAAQAKLDQSERDLNYLEQLAESGAAKPREVADARATVASDRATLDAAVTARQRAAEQTQRLVIHAPFDGWVVDRLTETGQWASPGSDVARIISRGEIEAVLNVPERLINQVAVGESLEVSIEPLDLRAEGTVVSITPTGGNAARTFPVKVRLNDRDGDLKPGMSVAAHLPTSQREQQLTVPRDAVQFQSTGAVVWVARAGEQMPTAAPVQVRVLYGIGERFVIEPVSADDLPVDTQVVIEGAEVLMPGQPLVVLNGAGDEAVTDGGGAPLAEGAREGRS